VEGISDIRIIGIDEKRPPTIKKAPYIDLFFKLSHQAPEDWCNDFNTLLAKHPGKPRVKAKEGLFIDAWVRTPDDIVPFLEVLKSKITECNINYIERIEASIREAEKGNESIAEDTGEQGRLNKIIASLDFDLISIQA
jgi:hypothetical protein